MDNRDRDPIEEQHGSPEDPVEQSLVQENKSQASALATNKRPSTFQKTGDVDDPPFSRLFLLIPKAMSEEELRQAFQVHGTIQDIHMVRDRRNHESKGNFN